MCVRLLFASVGRERFQCGELLFQPHLLYNHTNTSINVTSPSSSSSSSSSAAAAAAVSTLPGLATAIYNSVVSCEFDLRSYLFGNIVLCGGASLTHNLSKRLQIQLQHYTSLPTTTTINTVASTQLLLPRSRIRIVAPDDRDTSVWVGGSILASLSSFNNWVSKQEWEETGGAIVHRKCGRI